MTEPPRRADLARIEAALAAAEAVLGRYLDGAALATTTKKGGSPVTAADLEVDELLHRQLVAPGEGWLSEESGEDFGRLDCERVWIVDPLDGTHELLAGVPEWCVSIGLIEDGVAVAGGICNPAAGETILGGVGHGVFRNGVRVPARPCAQIADAVVLSSRSETARGEWERFAIAPFTVRPTGSVAYKLALVAAGAADATWTRTPKHEWDVAAGTALITAVGGRVRTREGEVPRFNQRVPRFTGLIATSAAVGERLDGYYFTSG